MDPKNLEKVKALLQQAMDLMGGSSADEEDAADGGADDAEEDDSGALVGKKLAMKMQKYK